MRTVVASPAAEEIERSESERLRALLHDVAVTASTTLAAASGLDLAQAITDSITTLKDAVGASHCVLIEVREGRPRPIAATSGTPTVLHSSVGANRWLLGELAAGRHAIAHSLDDLPPEATNERIALQDTGVRAALVVPLGASADRGSLALYWVEHEMPSPLAVEMLQLIGYLVLEAGARRRTEEALVAARDRSRAYLTHLDDVVGLVRLRDGIFVEANQACERFFGIPPEELIGSPISTPLLAPCDPETLEPLAWSQRASRLVMSGEMNSTTQLFAHRRRDGRWAWGRQVVERVDVGGEPHVVITITDVTAQREADQLQQQQALHDPVTGVPTRRLYNLRLATLTEAARSNGNDSGIVVGSVALDGLRRVTLSLGHDRADEVLATMVDRISGLLGPGDVVAQLTGVELGIASRCTSDTEARALLGKVTQAVTQPVRSAGDTIGMKAWVGLAIGTPDEAAAGELTRRARSACRVATDRADPGGAIWDASIEADLGGADEKQLARAIDTGELELHYQPVVDLSTRRTVGAEALLRWRHPELGLIGPGRFLPTAEASGLIIPIGSWVIEQACADFARFDPSLTVAVNVSAHQIGLGLAAQLRDVVTKNSFKPDLLHVELTESALISGAERTVSDLNTIRAFGVRVGLDDFGTGYSPLSYLQDLHLDFLKIDRAFVTDSENRQSRGSVIVDAILTLATQLDLSTVAEGIEHEDGANDLEQRGCELAQGHFFGRAMPIRAFRERTGKEWMQGGLRAQRRRRTAPRREPVPARVDHIDEPRIVASKLAVPQPRPTQLTRSDLIKRLEEQAEPIVLVSGPGGSGKTTVVAQWALAWSPSVAWVSLDPDDSDVRRFWIHLAAAIRQADPRSQRNATAALRADGDLHTVVLPHIIEQLAQSPMRIVLDDYHLIDSAEVDESVAHFAERLPPQCTLVISTRAEPTLPIARWRARGMLAEIRDVDLRIGLHEAARLLNDCLGLELTAEQVEQLSNRTDGWIAGLYLAALAVGRANDADEVVASFGGAEGSVLAYMLDDVISALDDNDRDLLSAVSIVDRFTPGLADALTGGSGAAARLRDLERRNQLVIPLDTTGDWYRLHHLLSDALQFDLRASRPERVVALHRLAAEWMSENGYHEAAFTHADATGDDELVRELLRRHWVSLGMHGRLGFLTARLQQLPDDIVEADPELAFAVAYITVTSGDAKRVRRLLEVVEVDGADLAFKIGLHDGRQAGCLLRANYPFDGVGPACQAARRLREFDKYGGGSPVWIAYGNSARGSERWNAGDDTAALNYFKAAYDGADMPLITQRVMSWSANIMLDNRDFDGAAEMTKRARELADLLGLTTDPRVSLVLCAEARQAENDEARTALVDEALRLAADWYHAEIALYILASLLPVVEAAGDHDRLDAATRLTLSLLERNHDVGRSGVLARKALEALDTAVARPRQVSQLTDSEARVLTLLATTTLSQQQMTRELGITLNTLKSHIKSIYRKLSVNSRPEVIVRAKQLNLVA